MLTDLPEAPHESMIYEDEWLYVCLALYPLAKGHTIIVWKGEAKDLKFLSDSEYDYLMEIMDIMRDALLQVLGIEKVYLMYMDEIHHVHWHLLPRYEEKGFNVFLHEPERTHDFSLAPALQAAFNDRRATRDIRLPGENTDRMRRSAF